jgi:hypothetical protein
MAPCCCHLNKWLEVPYGQTFLTLSHNMDLPSTCCMLLLTPSSFLSTSKYADDLPLDTPPAFCSSSSSFPSSSLYLSHQFFRDHEFPINPDFFGTLSSQGPSPPKPEDIPLLPFPLSSPRHFFPSIPVGNTRFGHLKDICTLSPLLKRLQE